jgi:signal peptidase I
MAYNNAVDDRVARWDDVVFDFEPFNFEPFDPMMADWLEGIDLESLGSFADPWSDALAWLEQDRARKKAPRRGRRVANRVGFTLSASLLLLSTVGRLAVEPVTVSSASMQPTLMPGGRLVVEKVSLHFSQLRRGELVVVEDPHGGAPLVKRVIAVGGERVQIDSGVLRVDGDIITDQFGKPDAEVAEFYGPLDVPKGSIFVVGDNRRESDDSREFGPITASHIIGRVLFGA